MTGRASNGESTIFKGADGRWHGYVSVGYKLNGRLDRRHVSSMKRSLVVDKVRELERKRDSGTVTETSTPTVAAWLEHWLANIAPRRVRQRTVESYESSVRKHLIPAIGRHRLDRLRPEHLDQLYMQLLDAGYSPATVLRDHRILSRALTVAMQRGHIARNVATLVDPPRQEQSDIATALNVEEARAVVAAAMGTRNAARWTVALALGLRQSEALALQWKDIDLLANTLTVRRSIHRVRGGLVYEEPKTRRSQRTLELPLPLVAMLHEHKAAQLGEQMLAGSEWNDEDLVFAQPNGRPIDKKADYDAWTALLDRSGVRHVRLHDGRHTAATLLLTENVHPRVVMELLGHSQIRTTLDIYTHTFHRCFTPQAVEDEVLRAQDTIASALHRRPRLYRPPWLVRTPATFRVLARHRLLPVSGTFCHPLEVAQCGPARIANRTVARSRPGRILIFHDGYNGESADRARTLEAVDRTIDTLAERGWSFATVDELLGIDAYDDEV